MPLHPGSQLPPIARKEATLSLMANRREGEIPHKATLQNSADARCDRCSNYRLVLRSKSVLEIASNHKKYSRRRNDKPAAFIGKRLIRFWLSRNRVHPFLLGVLGFELGPDFLLRNKQTQLCPEEVLAQ